jgi:L-alanine-DL-glutamate epimerase-like enolase superfamily enzyme
MITVRHRPLDLALRHTFRLSRGASDERHNLLVEIEDGGRVGLGEAAPIPRYGQDRDSAARAVEAMTPRLGDPRAFATAADRTAVAGQEAAAAAVDMALRDLAGQRLGAPLYELMGLDPRAAPPTSFTIAMDTPEVVARKVAEASDYEALKVKMGSDDDRVVLETVRALTDRPLRVDANEGWTLEGALSRLEWLRELGVELVEQPLPAGNLAAVRELRRASPLPLFADEDLHRAADVPRLAEAYDGVNVKLMKCGGIGEALRIIATARAHGMQVMLGCMIESSVAITAAAHLSPLVDFADLDGNLLIRDDPFVGATVSGGRIVLPEGPGLGVRSREPGP